MEFEATLTIKSKVYWCFEDEPVPVKEDGSIDTQKIQQMMREEWESYSYRELGESLKGADFNISGIKEI